MDARRRAVAELMGEELARAIARAAATERFKGKSGSALTLLSPNASLDKLVVIGTASEGEPIDATLLGGQVAGKIGERAGKRDARRPGT